MTSDIERALSPADRRLKGQHFTASRVADLINAFCLRSGADVVVDPACGIGWFLLRAQARLRHLGGDGSSLLGVEIAPRLAAVARARLSEAVIVTGDFLVRPQALERLLPVEGSVDAVVGNPPYVRQELLPASLKRRLSAKSPLRLSGRSDLHVYFWHPSMRMLKEGGRLGFLTGAAWLDASYGEALRRWLSSGYRVIALVESEVESWFDEARVRTVVTIVEKGIGDRRSLAAPLRLARLGFRLDEVAPDGLPEGECLARFEDLARDIERGATAARRGTRIRSIARAGLTARRWGPLLRQPDLWFEILARAGDRLVELSQVATVRWGIKTGDDRCFFIGRDAPAPVEPRFLAPVVFNLMELDRMVVTPEQLRRRLLLIDLRRGGFEGTKAMRWIQRAERERASHRRPTCAARERHGRGRRRWFELRPGASGEILWSIMHQYRHLAPLNPWKLPANDNLLALSARPGVDPRLLASLLNSHLQVLIKQAYGRRRNEGMLKTQAIDVKEMLVPDPRRVTAAAARRLVAVFDALARRPIGTVVQECRRPDRRRLDLEVMRALGLGGADAAAMVDRLYETLIPIYRAERRWELDAISRRASGPRRRARGLTRAALRSASARAD